MLQNSKLLSRRFSRRWMLSLIRGMGTTLVVAGWPKPAIAITPQCVVRPQQTEGPYFVDEKLKRSDIRSNPGDRRVKPGVPLQLTLQVARLNGRQCQPLAGAIVDIWHCDATGAYSDVADPSFNTIGQKFLRGYQVTDANGRVQFLTIYPGGYAGRTVHIHFKVRATSAGRPYEFTSQLYFEDALTDRVHAQAPYRQARQRRTRNQQDGIFRQGGEQLMLAIVPANQGYTATFSLGLQMA